MKVTKDMGFGTKAIHAGNKRNLYGSMDTLIAHGTTMTHDDCSEELLKTIGITPDLIRMSIGIENKEDIIADLAQALDRVTAE